MRFEETARCCLYPRPAVVLRAITPTVSAFLLTRSPISPQCRVADVTTQRKLRIAAAVRARLESMVKPHGSLWGRSVFESVNHHVEIKVFADDWG